jgi:2-methylcitrate dehydratase PrpD
LKLDHQQVRMALGIAASLAAGLRQNFGTMTKPLHGGRAAANGIQAACLARAGFTADENILEAPLGFAKVFGHDEEVDWTSIMEDLGKSFLITGPEGLSIKPYPSCGFTHCAIDAAIALKKNCDIDINAIHEIELGVSPFDKKILIHHIPKTELEGKFSLEYCVARALVSDKVRLQHFTAESVAEPQVKNLAEKMRWLEKYPLPEMGTPEGFGTKSVTVKMRDGKDYTHQVTIAKGMPQNPLSTQEFKAKFRDCASVNLDSNKVEKCLSLLSELEKLKPSHEGKKGFITDILSP